ncbi:DNA gyrase subunit A [Rathayibacter tanaceti]|uniref:DNA gyrase subunit A n=1 Tax=Rathayibacter tanaceti TaxID=1671680 RepID=A0A166IJP6_9MICO|nr:DNA gyrase subunit A [Rathayibacter tanaceti]
MELLDIDEVQSRAILDMQLRRLAALERQKIIDEHDRIQAEIEDYKSILASPARQRTIISDELDEIVERFGDDRRTEILFGFDGDMSVEDLIPEEEMVVTVTRGGYLKRTRSDSYRAQHRGGRGVRGAQLKADDIVEHFFVTTTHHWLLFFTNTGRVYRAKTYELQEAGRDAKGQHIANLLALEPGEQIAQILDIRDYEAARYLVLATRDGLVKKTALSEYDTNRSGGIIAIKLRDGDELVSALLVEEDSDVLLVSRKGMSIRFTASDEALRPMGRSTSGVRGMAFRGEDRLLDANVVSDEGFVFVVTEGASRSAPPSTSTASRAAAVWASRWPSSRRSGAISWAPSSPERTTRSSSSSPAARWYALPWPRYRPRVATPWESSSHDSRRTTASSHSPRTPNAISTPRTRIPTPRRRPSPARCRRRMGP